MYIDYGIEPLFPFGYGLSYTKFDYSNLVLSEKRLKPEGSLTISADVENTGNFETDEVVQLYIRDKVGSLTRPVKELKGFQKIHLKPGDVKKVSFIIKPENLEYFNGERYVTEPGNFDVWIGPNSAEGLKAGFAYED